MLANELRSMFFTREYGQIWVCLKIGYIPNEIAIFHRDNDQQNHWVQWGTLFSDTPKYRHKQKFYSSRPPTAMHVKSLPRCSHQDSAQKFGAVGGEDQLLVDASRLVLTCHGPEVSRPWFRRLKKGCSQLWWITVNNAPYIHKTYTYNIYIYIYTHITHIICIYIYI